MFLKGVLKCNWSLFLQKYLAAQQGQNWIPDRGQKMEFGTRAIGRGQSNRARPKLRRRDSTRTDEEFQFQAPGGQRLQAILMFCTSDGYFKRASFQNFWRQNLQIQGTIAGISHAEAELSCKGRDKVINA